MELIRLGLRALAGRADRYVLEVEVMLICTLDTFFKVFAAGVATPVVILIAIVAFWPSKKDTPNGRN